MTKIFLTILFGLIYFQAFCQTESDTTQMICWGRICELTDEQLNNSGTAKLTFANSITEAEQLANKDISNGTTFLLLAGGIAPTIIATDPAFEKKYDIYFNEFGCNGPDDNYITAYNKVVFEHLTQKFGTRWYREVRQDVVGLKEWRRTN